MNATKAALQLPAGDVPLLQNVRARPFHNWAKRRGIETAGIYDSPVNGIFELELDGLIIPIFQSGAALTFFPTVTTASFPNTPDPYRLGDGRTSLAIDPAGVDTLIVGRTGGVSSACSYALSSSSTNIDETQQNIIISVTAYAGCSWNAVPNDAWLTTVTGSAHLSGGSYTVQASANAGAARVGTISFYRGSSGTSSLIGTFTVNQASGGGATCTGGNPTYSIVGYTATTFSSACAGCLIPVPTGWGGVFTITVASCVWTGGGLSLGSPLRLANADLRFFPGGGGYYQIEILCTESGTPNIWTGRKTTGTDPAGVYTKFSGCSAPATITLV